MTYALTWPAPILISNCCCNTPAHLIDNSRKPYPIAGGKVLNRRRSWAFSIPLADLSATRHTRLRISPATQPIAPGNFFSDVGSGFEILGGDIVDGLGDAPGFIGRGLKDTVENFADPSFWSDVADGAGILASDIGDGITDGASFIWEGLKNSPEAVAAGAEVIASDVWDGIKDIL